MSIIQIKDLVVKLCPLISATCALFLLSGCGTTEEVDELPEQIPQPPVVQPTRPPAMQLETRTDTVNAVHGAGHPLENSKSREPQVKFMVQIGAFKNPHNASAVQILARERYHLPVLNDYNTKSGLYHIRIGFFETKESAYAFRQKMLADHPDSYKDSWVVQLRR